MLVDTNAGRRNLAPRYAPKAFYGQLQHVMAVNLPAIASFGLQQPTTLFLAGIRSCALLAENSCGMPYYEKMGHFEVVDMNSVQCLVARIPESKAQKRWAIVDRSSSINRSFYVEDE